MIQVCPGVEFCYHEDCVNAGMCLQMDWHTDAPIGVKSLSKRDQARHVCPRNQCEKNKRWMCEILGECIYRHPLVMADKKAPRQIKSAKKPAEVLKVLDRLMPSLKRIGKRRYLRPELKYVNK